MLRCQEHPAKTAKELIIRIIIDGDKHQLTYHDDARGIPLEKLTNLVLPGYRDMTDLTATMGG